MNTPASSKSSSSATHPLDALTGGAFSAPTTGERAGRVRDWLATEPSLENMNEVFKELSQRDRGAAKPLKEKLDEQKRQKAQEHIAAEWATRAQAMIAQPRLNLADAMAWQRDAARAGAPLSREPLAGLKAALADRVKAIEDLQHRVQVERESAVLMAQRIEVMSTKPWRDAQQTAVGLRGDVADWQLQVGRLSEDPQWASVEAKFPPMLESSRNQLQLVWDAFEAALLQAAAADTDPKAPLPAVPVWADELRVARGEPAAAAAEKSERDSLAAQERRAKAVAEFERVIAILEQQVAEGHGKATPKAAADVRNLVKSQSRLIGAEREARAHAALKQAGDLEDWQRWRADQLREELVAKAEALMQAPEGQRMGGRKMQETLRSLRDQWKTTDQGGLPNHALWKRFDEACTLAHKEVETWLVQVRQQSDAHRAQRLGIIQDLNQWTEAFASNTDWKLQLRELHAFSERWRGAGHLSEKMFAELQPVWKAAMSRAHQGLETAQKESNERRRAMIEEATALGAAPQLRIDAVKALQQRWQAEAHGVPLDRKHEQKLWEAFRQPIDDAFNRKSSERERANTALNAHDQSVLDAAKSLEAAIGSEDVRAIQAAMDALEKARLGQAEARAVQTHAAQIQALSSADVPLASESNSDAPVETVEPVAPEEGGEPAPSQEIATLSEPVAAPKVVKKIVAVRGDDRPGMKKSEPAGRDDRRGPGGRDAGRGGPGAGRGPGRGAPEAGRWGDRADREPRGPMAPRLGDAAFRAQRNAVEHAEAALRKLAAQAHGEVLTDLMKAWESRDASVLPAAPALGGRVNAATRGAWGQSLSTGAAALPADTLLRLEMAAEVPTPAEHLSERRMLQLQLLTRRNDPAPADTWAQDVAKVLGSGFDAGNAKRLQTVLKVLLKR